MQRGSRRNRLLDVWVGTPALNLVATLRRRRPPPSSLPRRVGVMCSPALGDTLLFSGALGDLRSALPAAEITHVCMRQNLAAAELLPGGDRHLLIDLTRPWTAIPLLRRERFDVLLDFTSWQRLTAFLTVFSGSRYTVGFRSPGQRRSRGFDTAIEHRADRHEMANFRALLLGSRLPVAWGPAHTPAVVLPAIASVPFAGEGELIALHLWASGGRAHLREWPETRWVELARKLASPGTLFLLTGAPSDADRGRTFLAKLHAAGLRAELFVSQDGFRTLAHLLLRCRLVVTVNTGVMHLAAIVGAPTVAINGPNRNARWGPVGPRAFGVEPPGAGCGFLHLGFNFDGNPVDCMERIPVGEVLAACRAMLAVGEKARPADTLAEVR